MLSNASIIFTRFSLPDLDDDFTAQDMKNIQRIYKNVLMKTNSREQQKALVKKYLKWVSRQQKRKTNCCVLFLFSTTFQTTSEKIQLLRTWNRRCDLPIISWVNSQKILLLLERRLLNNIVRLASLFLIYVYCASLLFHCVISSVKLDSVGSFSFFAVRTEIAQLVILTNLGV